MPRLRNRLRAFERRAGREGRPFSFPAPATRSPSCASMGRDQLTIPWAIRSSPLPTTEQGRARFSSGSDRHRGTTASRRIVGGGAAGLPLATKLGDTLGRRGQATITLVDHNASHLWKPLLHEVAAGRMDADVHDVDYFLMAYWHHFRFRQGAVVGLDRARRELKLGAVRDDDGAEMLPERDVLPTTRSCSASAASATTSASRVWPSARSRSTRAADAERFHRRLVAACVRADERAARGESATVDIVIIGAGATGVELAAEIRHCTGAHASYGLEHLRPGARHPAHAHRGRAAHPAAAVGRDRGGGHRAARQARRRRAHRRARHGDRRRRRAHGERRGAAGRSRRLGGGHQGAGLARRISTASRSIARISSSSPRRSRPRAIRTSSRWAIAPRARGRRPGAKARSCRRARRSRASRRRCL